MAFFLDTLIGLLIVFPLLGGLWIQRPGLKLELTELAIPAIVVFAFAAWLKEARAHSWFVRKGREAFARWQNFVVRSPISALGFGTVFVSLLWAFASLRRNWAFQSKAFDLGIFTNTIWNLTHGYGYVSSVKGGINLFTDHQSPIFWVLAPVFSLFPSPTTLLVAQAIGLSLGAWAVYALGKQYRKDSSLMLAALPLLYWCYLPVRAANLFDFHPEVFMLPLFLWSLVGIQSSGALKKTLGWIAFLAALGCKESAGPIAVGIGIAWLAGAAPGAKKLRMEGVVAIVFGLAVFVLDLKVVPQFFETQYIYGSLYAHLASGPRDWIRTLFAKSRFRFLVATLAPLGFLPLLSPRALIAVLPAYGMLFLSQGDSRLSLQFHYGIEPAVGLFWALAAAVPVAEERLRARKISLSIWILFWALVSFGRSEMYWIRRYEPTRHERWLRTELLRCLASAPSVTANGGLVPQVSTRHWVQQIPDLGPIDQPNDCVLIDGSIDSWPLGPAELEHWRQTLTTRGYTEFFACGPTFVYQRQAFSGACLRCLPECPKSPTQ